MTAITSIRVLLCLTIVTGIVAPATNAEKNALEDLYRSTFNKNIGGQKRTWNRYNNWMKNDPCDGKWQGVTCTFCPSCRVTKISLYNNQLRGSLPASLKVLTKLRHLDLGVNSYGDPPDDMLSGMTELEFLRLGNSLSGILQDWTSSRKTLTFIEINGAMSGTLPLAYLDLPNINDFRLYSTKLTGGIPSFDPLRNAEHIRLAYNRNLYGTVPSLDKLTNLKTLRITNCRVSGTLPPFTSLTKIVDVNLWRNSLSGTVPDFPVKALDTLEHFDAEENVFQEFSMYENRPAPGVFKKLKYLNMEENILTGTVPCHRTAFPALAEWISDRNFLTGTIPCLDDFAGLSKLQLSANSFTGTLPDTKPAGISSLSLNRNKLSGTIPFNFVNNLIAANTIALGANCFSGTVPNMPNLPSLENLYLHRNSEWKPMKPVRIEPQEFEDLAMDGDQNTEYTCTPPKCSILIDFGEDVCVEAMVSTFPVDIDTSLPISRRTAGVVTDIRFYQGRKSFDSAETIQPMTYHSHPDDYIWNVNAPGAEHVMSRHVVHDDKLDAWPPYCQVKTRYYRLDLTSCHGKPCRIPEWTFYSGQRLSGSIPSFAGLPKLDTFHIYGNNMSGVLPDVSGNDWEGSLRVEDNQLTGINNTDFCPHFRVLNELRFDHNLITGTIPPWECMKEIQKISVGANPLTGTLPPVTSSALKDLYAEETACCVGWEHERLQSKTKIYPWNLATDCPRCDTGLEGHLLPWTGIPNLERIVVDDNELSGTVGNVGVLTKLETFSIISNKLAGTLPYTEMIVAGNGTTSCVTTAWHMGDNSFWGPVPNIKQPLTTRSCNMGRYECRCGRYTHSNDGRKIYHLQFDNNYLWGPAPTNVERTISHVIYNENCWNCPLLPKAIWNASCLLNEPGPCFTDEKKKTRTSPEPTWTGGYGSVKGLTRPPVCTEPPAERYSQEGPSCIPEPKDSLYEHVTRCQTMLYLNRTLREDEVRSGKITPPITITFNDGAVLPYFAPSMWDCTLPEAATPLGPRGIDFTQPMRNTLFDDTVSGSPETTEPFGWNFFKNALISPAAYSLQETHPYIKLPTELVMEITSGTNYDIANEEVVTVKVDRKMFLTPFGPEDYEVTFNIIPVNGTVVRDNIVVNESAVKDDGVEIIVKLEIGETWMCDDCTTTTPLGITEDWTNATDQTKWAVEHTRTCSWNCAVPQNAGKTPFQDVKCIDNQTLSLFLKLTEYNINEVQSETISVVFPDTCFKSNLQAKNAVFNITIVPIIEPTLTITPTYYKTGTATETETSSVTVTQSVSVSVTMSRTAIPLPFCYVFESSVLCSERSLVVGNMEVFGALLLLGLLTAVFFWLFCTRKPPPIDVTVDRVQVTVEEPKPPLPCVMINVNTIPQEGVNITVRKKDADPPGGITVTARKQFDLGVTITARSVAPVVAPPSSTSSTHPLLNNTFSSSGSGDRPTFNSKLL
eukprot:TRINITY_DN6475_c2_g1_i1.p1 TRINITY_DN6475_c2_g1~~TRINITY_DN6475_c2_g1_i1.p1  ORF type:complete len:1478 (+),score=214.92 TRINITY_DN6475_c2_g1_i1:58-4434(+)